MLDLNNSEVKTFREKFMVLLKKHYEKIDKGEILQNLVKTNLYDEQIFL